MPSGGRPLYGLPTGGCPSSPSDRDMRPMKGAFTIPAEIIVIAFSGIIVIPLSQYVVHKVLHVQFGPI